MRLIYRFIALALLAAPLAKAESKKLEWCTLSDVEKLAVAISVADFPLSQGKLKEVLGLKNAHPVG